jgi:hypothetical protein
MISSIIRLSGAFIDESACWKQVVNDLGYLERAVRCSMRAGTWPVSPDTLWLSMRGPHLHLLEVWFGNILVVFAGELL